jgi:hypothetical protein
LEILENAEMRGYQVWDVIIHKTEIPSEELFQLFIPKIATRGLVESETLKKRYCASCNTTMYDPHTKGKMVIKRSALPTGQDDIIQSFEWYGGGSGAFREFFVSHRFAKLILDEGLKGAYLQPLELVD